MHATAARRRPWPSVATAFLAASVMLTSGGCAAFFTPEMQAIPTTSMPEGAEVWLDGEWVGITPVIVEVGVFEDHELIVRLGERESVWELRRTVSDVAAAGISLDLIGGLPVVLLGSALAIEGGRPCGPQDGWFRFCGNPDMIGLGIAIAAVGLTPIVIDAATNDLYELVPREIVVEFD